MAEGTRMPRFHFNIMDGVSEIDREGTELPNVDAAWREARHLASGIIKEGWGVEEARR